MLTLTEENYLKAIFHLEQAMRRLAITHTSPVGTGVLAESMGLQAPTVTDMIRKLADRDLVDYERSKGVNLTDKGYQVALQIVRRHRIWETFLARTLNFDWSQVHELAEQLEHIQSEELINRLEQFLDYPTVDPHGDPIPDAQGHLLSTSAILLADADLRSSYIITGITDHSPMFLQYLEKVGLRMGTRLTVQHREAFDQSISALVNGNQEIVISPKAVMAILVSEEDLSNRPT